MEDRANLARQAFDKLDVEESKRVHEIPVAPEKHGGSGSEFIKSLIFGGLDGISTIFAIVASSFGATFSTELILLLGVSKLVADAISMGFGDYLSESAKNDYETSEFNREKWELENYPDGEKKEMIDLYKKNYGFSDAHAQRVVELFSKSDLLLKHMMVEELGMLPPEEQSEPFKNGMVTLLSFIVFGSVPLWCYLFFWAGNWQNYNGKFSVACVATALTMFLLGLFKAQFTKQPRLVSGAWVLINGLVCAVAAYLVGYGLEQAFNVSGGK